MVMLEAAGYPNKKGALDRVAKACGVPISTLHGWFNSTRNPPPADVRNEKRLDLAEAIRYELSAIINEFDNTRPGATYKELATAFGILVDKLQLIQGGPTERHEFVVKGYATVSPDDWPTSADNKDGAEP